MLSIWGAGHLAGALLGDPSGKRDILYSWWLLDGVLRYDQIVHGFGIATVTLAIAYASRRSPNAILRGFLWGQAVGVGNEIIENVFAALVDGSNVGDAVNTTWDLVFHVIGGTAAVFWLRRRGYSTTENRSPKTA